MSYIDLTEKEVKVLRAISTPLLVEHSFKKKAWNVVTKTKLSILLWIDMVSHFTAILNGEENWVEAVLTILAFFSSNLFTFPLVNIRLALINF